MSDRKIEYNNQDYYTADVVSYSDYSPHGTLLDGRHGNETSYRYGFNGMEKDDEIKDISGSSYTTEFRQYDPRLGRWLSLDPLMAKYPGQSPYAAFNNNPIYFADPTGLEGENPTEHNEGKEVENAPKSNSLTFSEEKKHPFTNYNVKIAGQTGTITLYTQDAKNIVTSNGYLQSFEIYENTYSYSTDYEGNFNGFRTSEGVLYAGNSVFSNVPWHYSIEERSRDGMVVWPIISGKIQTGYGEWTERNLETWEVRIVLGYVAARMSKSQAAKWAMAKFPKFGSLTEREKDAIAAAISVAGLTDFDVESRDVRKYRVAHDWYGKMASSISGNAYIVPTGVSKAYEIGVGVGKVQWRVLWKDIDLGIIHTDTIEGMLDTTTSAGPPKAKNKH